MPIDRIKMELNEEERDELISRFVAELPVLRKMLGLSQDEMSKLLDIARQTYSSLETRKRKMSWTLYLAMLLIFDYNDATHDVIRQKGLFPTGLVNRMDIDKEELPISSFLQVDDEMTKGLDEQAMHAIETVIMMEYARCNNMSGDAVIKAFDGKRFSQVK